MVEHRADQGSRDRQARLDVRGPRRHAVQAQPDLFWSQSLSGLRKDRRRARR